MIARTVTNEPSTANYDSTLPQFNPAPIHNAGTLTCGSVYCHGYFKNGNTTFAPVWNDTTSTQAACGTCHGDVTRPTLAERALPKTTAQGGTHPNATNCSSCHGDVVNASLQIINKDKHVNGRLNVFGVEQDF
jgi:predicted CxxxxCH...CXXCH cytochrome family protein